MKLKRILWTLIFGLSTTFVAWYGLHPWLTKQNALTDSELPQYKIATVLTPAATLNDFKLVSSTGKMFEPASFLGNWTLLFFGYSRCPDICPSTLVMVKQLFKDYAELNASQKISFVFVSLDPQSDSTEALGQFLNKFDPRFIGLTGDAQEIDALAKSCRVHSFPEISSKTSKQTIDHSASLLLINPEGRLHAIFSPPYTALGIAEDMHKLIHSPSSSKI